MLSVSHCVLLMSSGPNVSLKHDNRLFMCRNHRCASPSQYGLPLGINPQTLELNKICDSDWATLIKTSGHLTVCFLRSLEMTGGGWLKQLLCYLELHTACWMIMYSMQFYRNEMEWGVVFIVARVEEHSESKDHKITLSSIIPVAYLATFVAPEEQQQSEHCEYCTVFIAFISPWRSLFYLFGDEAGCEELWFSVNTADYTPVI